MLRRPGEDKWGDGVVSLTGQSRQNISNAYLLPMCRHSVLVRVDRHSMHREFVCRSEDANRDLLQAEARIGSQ